MWNYHPIPCQVQGRWYHFYLCFAPLEWLLFCLDYMQVQIFCEIVWCILLCFWGFAHFFLWKLLCHLQRFRCLILFVHMWFLWCFFVWFILIRRISTIKMKIYGEITSPVRMPCKSCQNPTQLNSTQLKTTLKQLALEDYSFLISLT